jgi:regulator of nonsense transcripts 2
MKTQQAAEREEQQRIKNLVLNYDLRDGEDQDGEDILAPIPLNTNIHKTNAGLEKAAATNYSRPDKSSNNRSGQRARKLQLSDVDWYDPKNKVSHVENASPPPERDGPASIDSHGPLNAVASLGGFNEQTLRRQPAKAKAQGGRISRKEMLAGHEALKATRGQMKK